MKDRRNLKKEEKDLSIIKIKSNRKLYLGRKPKLVIDRNKRIEKI